MKLRILAGAAGLLMFLSSQAVFAEVKIGVVDVQRALLQSEQAKQLAAQMQGEFKPEEEKIRSIQSEAAALIERMQKDGEVMSESEKRKLSQQIESKNNDFVYNREKLQRQAQERQQELFAGTDAKLTKAIEELVLEGDYDVILPRNAVLYVGDLYDITRKVTEKLNEMDKK